MNEYKVGDKFLIEIEEVYENGLPFNDTPCKLYRIKGFNSLVFDEYGLDKLQKHVVTKQSNLEQTIKTAYEKGMQKAWKLAKKLFADMSNSELDVIFGKEWNFPKLMEMTPQEALAKIENHEKEQSVIKVGDVVFNRNNNQYALVLCVKSDGKSATVIEMFSEELLMHTPPVGALKKTDKHIDIQSILSQIGE